MDGVEWQNPLISINIYKLYQLGDSWCDAMNVYSTTCEVSLPKILVQKYNLVSKFKYQFTGNLETNGTN